jgi:hypothetical protein
MTRNHTNNPRMPIYWELQGFSSEEAKVKAKAECRKSSVRCVEYWLNRGFTLEQAKEEVRRIQNNGERLKGRIATEEQKQNLSVSMKKLQNVEHWIEKYGEDIGRKKYETFKENKIQNGKKSVKVRLENDPDTFINSSIRRPEYWIRQGYTEEEAKIIISQKQSRSLEFYISKYGEEEGTKRWKEKNQKWYETFYESGKDLDFVNEKRRLNAHVGYYTKKTVKEQDKLNFYLITLNDKNNQIVKYGLTKQDNITKRWKVSLKYNIILFKQMNAYEAIDLENEFHKMFKKTYSPTIIKTTECFLYTDSNLTEAISLLKKYNITNINEEKLNG